MDDHEDDSHRRRSGRSTGSGPAGREGEQRSSRKKKSSESASSPARRKSKKKATTAEDALEAKMRAKSKREKTSSKAEDALEAKIRKKNAAASSSSRRAERNLEEEEKVEEGFSVGGDGDDDDDDSVGDEERGGGGGYNPGYDSSRNSRGGVVASAIGLPDPSSSQTNDNQDPNAIFTRGGGDVRNRPPQQQQSIVLDPLRQAELQKQKNKKEVNQRYADLHETGQWGGLTKWEKYGICVLTLGAIIAAIVLGIQFGSGGGEDETPPPTSTPTMAPSQSPSTSPTMAPTDVSYREITGLELMSAASPKLTLPQTPQELEGAKTRTDSKPQELAAEFVLYDDPMELPARDPRFMERYALAVFYYQNGGCIGDWITRSNWLGDDDHCGNWHGIVCDLKKRVIEVNLSKNYVTGKIPIEFAQLLELSTLDLSNNAMVGTVPAEALSMSRMYTIQLNNNLLEGEFPFEEVKRGAVILDNLWIQENTQLTGTITDAYCTMNSITLDCENFGPQPVYDPDNEEGLTTFVTGCLEEQIGYVKEYTCNFDDPDPFTKPPPEGVNNGTDTAVVPAPSPAVCGTPAAGA